MVQSMIEHECATDVVYIAATWGATEVIRPAAVAVAADRPSPRRPVQTATADLVGKHTINCGRHSNTTLLCGRIVIINHSQDKQVFYI